MGNEYRYNHYVPEWYQKRFIPDDESVKSLYYLDLKPETITIKNTNISYKTEPLTWWGPSKCFAQQDLYTTQLGSKRSTEIEELFFGNIDRNGREAVEYFSNFTHPSVNQTAFNNMLIYLSTQKLRTLKGLNWLAEIVGISDQNKLLDKMMELRQLYSAIWTECVWLIADASKAETKFIISDHPVTVYNRRCGPKSQWCRGFNDPEIWLHGTHTLFPLSLDKILILTNLSWVRNPYQNPVENRPHPDPFRHAMFKFTDIQTLRYLDEQEVREINFIIKNRSLRYIAAAKKEWLYPDQHVSKSDWSSYGDGYLLMPDPRPIHVGGEITMIHSDGTFTSFDEYGRRPWHKDYNKESRTFEESETLDRFKGEFARLYGPKRRGRICLIPQVEAEEDNDKFHQYHLGLEKKPKRKVK